MTTVCFVRHARSTYNDEGRMAGLHDPPLTEIGRREAQLTATHLKDTHFDAAYSSPLKRAVDTAGIVWGIRTPPVSLAAEIHELDMGQFSGRKWTEVLRDFPAVFPAGEISFWGLFSRDRIPDQEPYRSAVARIDGFFSRLQVNHPDQTVLVVGHKGVLEVFLSEAIGYAPSVDFFEIGSASVTVFELRPGAKTKFLAVNVCPGNAVL